MKKNKTWLAAVFAVAALAFATPASATGTIQCGGVGADERAALAAQASSASVVIEFHVAGRAAYIADVDVTIAPAAGSGDSVSTHADGPVCYAMLTPGRYRVQGTFNGVTRSANASVGVGAKGPVRLSMGFPPAGGPDDLDQQPSPEERTQAKSP